MLIVHLMDADDDSFDTPSGWGKIDENIAHSNLSNVLYWKRAIGTESGTETFTSTKLAGSLVAGIMYRVSGCITSGTPYEGNVLSNIQQTTNRGQNLTSVSDDVLGCAFFVIEDNVAASVTSANFIERSNLTTAVGSDACFTCSTRDMPSAETSSAGYTWGTSEYNSVGVLALLPAAPSGDISGTANGVSAVSGILKGKGKLSGTVNGVSSVSGAISGTVSISGTSDGVSAVSGSLSGKVFISGTSNGATRIGLKSGLISVWELDETSVTDVIDANGNNDGTNNGATVNQTGKINKAYLFEGGTDRINIPNTDFNFEYTDGFSISAWINRDSASNLDMIFSKTLTDAISRGYAFYATTDGTLRIFLRNNITGPVMARIATTGPISSGSWHHVVCTYNGNGLASGLKLYVNGSLADTTVDSDTLAGNTILNAANTNIGCRDDSNGSFSGLIDSVVVYNYEISEKTVSDIYNDNKGLAYIDFGNARLTAKGALSGSVNTSSSVSGNLSATVPISGTVDGNSIVNGILTANGELTGTINGVSSVTGILKGILKGAGTINGLSIVTGILKASGELKGTVSTFSDVTGVIQAKGKLSGIVNGVSAVTGDLTSAGAIGYITGTANGVSTVSGILKALGELIGSSDSSSTVTGSLIGKKELKGTINGLSQVSGILKATGELKSTISGQSTVLGVLTALGSLVGIVSGVSSLTGNLTGQGALTGEINSNSSVTGNLLATGKLIGTSNGVSTVTGRIELGLIGTANGQSVVTGILTAKGELKGSVNTSSIVTGILAGEVSLKGTSDGVSDVSGILKGKAEFSGTSNGNSTVQGVLKGKAALSGQSNGVSSVTANLAGRAMLEASSNGGSQVSGTLKGKGELKGIINGSSLVTGVFQTTGFMSGTVNGSSIVTGQLSWYGGYFIHSKILRELEVQSKLHRPPQIHIKSHIQEEIYSKIIK